MIAMIYIGRRGSAICLDYCVDIQIQQVADEGKTSWSLLEALMIAWHCTEGRKKGHIFSYLFKSSDYHLHPESGNVTLQFGLLLVFFSFFFFFLLIFQVLFSLLPSCNSEV